MSYIPQIKNEDVATSANVAISKISGLQTALDGKEAAISAGTSAQYYRGDKTWAALNQAAVAGLQTSSSPTFAGLTLTGAITSPGAGANSERFGASSAAAGASSVAVGRSASAANSQTSAIGNSASAEANGGTTIGYSSVVTSPSGVAIGASAQSLVGGTGAVAVGATAQATARSVAIGYGATSVDLTVAIGYGAVVTGQSVAVGYATDTSGGSATAIGYTANSAGNASVAVGHGSVASATGSTAIGKSASDAFSGTAIGRGSTTTAGNQFVSGSGTLPINNVYFGKGVTNASPSAYAVNGTGGSGADIAGGDLNLAGGRGTGTGTTGKVNVQTAPAAGSTGSAANNLVSCAQFDAHAGTGTNGESRFLLLDTETNTLKRIVFGADNSGGAGLKVLCVAN